MTWLRPVLLLLGAAVAFATLTAAAVSEVDRHRKADRTLSARVEALEGWIADVDLALARYEADRGERQRVEWEMVRAGSRREVTAAVLLRPRRGEPVLVDLGAE